MPTQIFYHDKSPASPGAIYFYHAILGVTSEIIDINNDFRMIPQLAIDLDNDFRIVTFKEVYEDFVNDIRLKSNIIRDDINNDFRMYSPFKDIINDFRALKQVIKGDLNNDIRTLIPIYKYINNYFNLNVLKRIDIPNKITTAIEVKNDVYNSFITSKSIIKDVDNDIRTKGLKATNINNDFRMIASWQIPGDAGFQSEGKESITLLIDDVAQTDVDVDSITISQGLNSTHTASFDLARAFDDTMLDADSVVKIKYKEFILYQGYVVKSTPGSTPESIRVSCNDEYWNTNKTKRWFYVGHSPSQHTAHYYSTINEALAYLGLNTSIGNFVPDVLNCFGQGISDSVSNLVQACGNYSYYYNTSGEKILRKAESGSIVTLPHQEIDKNIGLYQVLSHSITQEDVDSIINKYLVQMGNSVRRVPVYEDSDGSEETLEYISYQYITSTGIPVWSDSLAILAKNSGTGYGWDYQNPSIDYKDVFRKFRLQSVSTKLGQWSNRKPPVVEIMTVGFSSYFGGFTLGAKTESFTDEGFTINYEGLVETKAGILGNVYYTVTPIITFSEPQVEYILNKHGELTGVRPKTIRVHLSLENKTSNYDYDPDDPEIADSTQQPDPTELSFYTDKIGDYYDEILNNLNYGQLSVQQGYSSYVNGELDYVPSWNDTAFARDLANWELSKTAWIKHKGNIEVTLDTMIFYNINLSKRIYIEGVTPVAMNINSISYNLNNFTATIELETYKSYTRTISLQYRGD